MGFGRTSLYQARENRAWKTHPTEEMTPKLERGERGEGKGVSGGKRDATMTGSELEGEKERRSEAILTQQQGCETEQTSQWC